MISRERFICALEHKEADTIPIFDSPWETTVNRWRKEGLPEHVTPNRYFNFDLDLIFADLSFMFPEEIIEETDEFIIKKNSFGSIIRNWKNRTSTPELIDFTITTRRLWEEYRHRMAVTPERFDWDLIDKTYNAARDRGLFVTYAPVIGYDKTQYFVGPETLLIAMVDDPAWVKEMFDNAADLAIGVAEEMLGRGYDFDACFYCDDLGYKNASLFSPAMFREIAFNAHKRFNGFFKERGKYTILHSCGHVKELIPQFIEAGLDCLQPLEVKAGMDLVNLKKMYGERLAFMGGIDVRKMWDPDPSVIEEELRTKIKCAKRGGGYIYHSDHSIPDTVSFRQYKRVMQLVEKFGSYK